MILWLSTSLRIQSRFDQTFNDIVVTSNCRRTDQNSFILSPRINLYERTSFDHTIHQFNITLLYCSMQLRKHFKVSNVVPRFRPAIVWLLWEADSCPQISITQNLTILREIQLFSSELPIPIHSHLAFETESNRKQFGFDRYTHVYIEDSIHLCIYTYAIYLYSRTYIQVRKYAFVWCVCAISIGRGLDDSFAFAQQQHIHIHSKKAWCVCISSLFLESSS